MQAVLLLTGETAIVLASRGARQSKEIRVRVRVRVGLGLGLGLELALGLGYSACLARRQVVQGNQQTQTALYP